MMNQFFNKLMKLRFCLGLLFFLAVFPTTNLQAIPINTLDSEGSPIYLEKEIEKNPEQFLDIIKKELMAGNLGSIGYIAKTLQVAMPKNPDVKSLYSIYLTSTGDIIKAKKELKEAQEYQGNNLYGLYAEAMLKHRERKYHDAERICQKAILQNKTHPYPRNILGRIYFDQEMYEKAYINFKKAIELAPEFIPGYSNLGAVCFTIGKKAQSIMYFNKAISLNEDSFGAHYGLAIVYQSAGNNALALDEYSRSYELDSSKRSLLEIIGKLQLQLGKYKEAQKTGQQMLLNKVKGAHVILGHSALQLGDIKEAMTQLQKAPKESLDAAYLMGYCFVVQGEYNKSLKQMEKVYKKNNLHFGAYAAKETLLFYLNEKKDINNVLKDKWNKETKKLLSFISACVYGSEGNWAEAEKEMQAADGLIDGFSVVGIDKSTLSASLKENELKYIALGVLLHIKDLDNSALSEFQKALKINKDSILANYWTAQIYLKKGSRDRAIAFFENSLKKAPTFFSSLYILGELNFTKGKTTTAANYYESALSVKKDTGLLIKLGVFYEHSKQYDKATGLYEQAINLSPDNFIGYNQLAWLYAKRKVNLDKALGLARKADTLQPGNTSILDTIGWIYCHKKKYNEALEYLKKAQKINPNDPSVLYHLGAVNSKLGNHTIAEELLRKSLKISDKFEGAEDAQKLLK